MKYRGIDIVALTRAPRLFEIKHTRPSKIILGKEFGFIDGLAKPENYIEKYLAVVANETLQSYAIRELEKKISRKLDERRHSE